MNQKTAKIIAAVIAGALALLMVFGLLADIVVFSKADAAQTVSSLNDKLSDLDAQKQKIQKELNKINSQKKSTMSKKAALDKQIDITEQEVDTINELISALDAKIAANTAELTKAKEDEKNQYEKFLKRVRIMEEEGTASLLGIILSADSFSDMLTRTELVGDIARNDKKLVSELADTRASIEAKQKELTDSKAQQASAKANLVKKQNSLASQYNEANAMIKTLNSEAASYEKAYNEAEAAQAAARAQLKKLLQSSGSSSTAFVGGTFMWPSKTTLITSYYGSRKDPITGKKSFHTGVDIGAKRGTDIFAANSGKVIVAGWSSKGYGNYVVIDHGGGKTTLYAHMSKILVSKGQTVAKGDTIGLVGSTGYSTGPHIHFEILVNGDHTNPMNYYKKG